MASKIDRQTMSSQSTIVHIVGGHCCKFYCGSCSTRETLHFFYRENSATFTLFGSQAVGIAKKYFNSDKAVKVSEAGLPAIEVSFKLTKKIMHNALDAQLNICLWVRGSRSSKTSLPTDYHMGDGTWSLSVQASPGYHHDLSSTLERLCDENGIGLETSGLSRRSCSIACVYSAEDNSYLALFPATSDGQDQAPLINSHDEQQQSQQRTQQRRLRLGLAVISPVSKRMKLFEINEEDSNLLSRQARVLKQVQNCHIPATVYE